MRRSKVKRKVFCQPTAHKLAKASVTVMAYGQRVTRTQTYCVVCGAKKGRPV